MKELTAGEECQIAAKSFSSFSGHIPTTLVKECMGMAILRGTNGVSVIRLPSGEWSAPCAISLESLSNPVAPLQETVLLFMTELAIYSLVTRANVALNQTHRFEPGPFGSLKGQDQTDIYVYVRFNGGFTPPELIARNMIGWIVKEDIKRHTTWHGESVTWFDVLTNKISVDRSSVGNALYVVLNLAAGSAQEASRGMTKKNYADVESWVNVAPSFKRAVNNNPTNQYQIPQVAESSQYSFNQPMSFDYLNQMNQMNMNQVPYPNSGMQIQQMSQMPQMPQMPQVNEMNQGMYMNQMQYHAPQNQMYYSGGVNYAPQNYVSQDSTQSQGFMNQGQPSNNSVPNYPYGSRQQGQ